MLKFYLVALVYALVPIIIFWLCGGEFERGTSLGATAGLSFAAFFWSLSAMNKKRH